MMAFVALVAGASIVVLGDQGSRAPAACAPYDRTAAEKYIAAAASDPASIPRQLDLARCYDTSWRFADGERTIVAALDLIRAAAAGIPEAPPGAPIIVGADIRTPGVVARAALEYPRSAVEMGVRGVVVIEARVDAAGRVRQTIVAESLGGLDFPANQAVKQLQFEPVRIGGKPVGVSLFYFVRFGLPAELMPADWIDQARFYASRGLYRPCDPAARSRAGANSP